MWMNEEESSRDSFGNVESVVIQQPVPLAPDSSIYEHRSLETTVLIQNQSQQCIKKKCACKSLLVNEVNPRWAGKKKNEQCNDDWTTIEIISLTSASLQSTEVIFEYNDYQEAVEFFNKKLIAKKWNPLKAIDSVTTNGKFSRIYTCRYIYHADCNCKIKVSYTASSKNVKMSWWKLGSAHLIPEGKGNIFLTKEDHDCFQHIIVPRKIDSLPIEMCELIETTFKIYKKA